MEDTWAASVGVSAAGNVVTILLALVVYVVRERCQKLHCKSGCHTRCCDLELDDRTIRTVPSHRPPGELSVSDLSCPDHKDQRNNPASLV